MNTIRLTFRVDRALVNWALLLLALTAGAPELCSESVSMVAYYPAPTGAFSRITATSKTIFQGSVKVGGTTAPAAGFALDVAGRFKSSTYLDLSTVANGALTTRTSAVCTQMATTAASPTPACGTANWYRTLVSGMLVPWDDSAVSHQIDPSGVGSVYFCCPCPANVVAGDCTGTAG